MIIEWFRQSLSNSTPPKRDGQAVHSSQEGNISSQHVGHVPEMRSSRWSASSSGRAFWINSPCCHLTNPSRSTWRSVTCWQLRHGTATTEVITDMICVPPFIPQNTTFFREQGDGLYWPPERGVEPCTHGHRWVSAWDSGKGYQIVSRPRIVSPIPSESHPMRPLSGDGVFAYLGIARQLYLRLGQDLRVKPFVFRGRFLAFHFARREQWLSILTH